MLYDKLFVVSCAAAVRKEISDETDRETGRSKTISTVPIYLSIYSPNGEMTYLVMYRYRCHSSHPCNLYG